MHTPDWLDRNQYPFESHWFATEAGKLHYLDEGRGEPILMMHGNPTWSFLYRHLIKRLRNEYRCVAPDHLGFGFSDKPRHWTYMPQDHATNLAALIEDLGLTNVTLVVQDWGGPIGLSWAVSNPDRVTRLVILNTWAWAVNRDPYYLAFSGLVGGPIGRWLIHRYNFFVNSIMPAAFGDRSKLTETAHEQYVRPLANPDDRSGCSIFPKQIVGSSKWLGQVWDGITSLTSKPTLIVWGMKDIAFRKKELRRWEETFPGAVSVHLDDVGHFVQEEAPDRLSKAVISFLNESAKRKR